MGGGGGGVVGNISPAAIYYGVAKTAVQKGWVGGKAGQLFNKLDPSGLPPEEPEPGAAPTMEDLAAREPDKERRRKQQMAALMAQGRQGTILTGPNGITPSNTVGGGGKQMVGA